MVNYVKLVGACILNHVKFYIVVPYLRAMVGIGYEWKKWRTKETKAGLYSWMAISISVLWCVT